MNKFLISVSGMAAALVLSTAAFGAVTTFTAGTTISASEMNANFANLNGNLHDGACIGAMTRVGPTCIDNNRARVTGLAGCNVEGTGATCAGLLATSQSTGTATTADTITQAQAARACTNAGKRLLTPAEFIAARQVGGTIVEFVTDNMEFVNVYATGAGAGDPAQAGYIGPRAAAGGAMQIFANTPYNAVVGGGTFLGFRCAR
jgi:hypothetical protein